MNQQRGIGNLGVLLLLAQVFNMGAENIPTVTLALVGAQTAIFLGFLPSLFSSAAGVCMNTFLVWQKQDWKRLFLSQFFHADDMHLYFNMASLLIKGRSLERRFGSTYFFWMVTVFTALTGVGYIGINLLLEERLQDHYFARLKDHYYATHSQCAVGFSGVLFALKVLTTHYTPEGRMYVFGFIPLPSRYIYWVELLLIQMITPNASFTGHLAGIIVGLLYVKGPLKLIMDALVSPASASRFRGGGRSTGHRSRSWFSSTGSAGGGNTPLASAPPAGDFSNAYAEYTGGLSEEEQLQRALQSSQPYYGTPPPPGLYPDLEELRSRRAQKYQ